MREKKRAKLLDELLTNDLLRARVSRYVDERTAKIDDDSACWEWTGAKQPAGYGSLAVRHHGRDVTITAHRVAYVLAFGALGKDQGLHVLHKCDNRACVRPDHLRAGTHTDNMRDMIRKGRNSTAHQKSGMRHHGAIHTDDEVMRVVALHKTGMTSRQIATETGLEIWFVNNVATGRAWNSVSGYPKWKRVSKGRKPHIKRAQLGARRKWLVLGLLTHRGERETAAIAALIGETHDGALKACRSLEKEGLIKRKGLNRGGFGAVWFLAPQGLRAIASSPKMEKRLAAVAQANNRLARGEEN